MNVKFKMYSWGNFHARYDISTKIFDFTRNIPIWGDVYFPYRDYMFTYAFYIRRGDKIKGMSTSYQTLKMKFAFNWVCDIDNENSYCPVHVFIEGNNNAYYVFPGHVFFTSESFKNERWIPLVTTYENRGHLETRINPCIGANDVEKKIESFVQLYALTHDADLCYTNDLFTGIVSGYNLGDVNPITAKVKARQVLYDSLDYAIS